MTNQTKNIKTVDSIIQHFEKKDVITKFFVQHKIADMQSIESVERYNKDANRGGLIINCKEKCNEQLEKILIDFKLGEPCIDQVYDSIYTHGKNCSKRIIMFGGVGKGEEIGPATDEYVVGSLITSMNEYPLNLYFVPVDYATFEINHYDKIFPNQVTQKFEKFELPSKERFREAEFWNVYFDALNQGFYLPWKAFEYGINNKSKFRYLVDDVSLELKLEWNKKGAFFTVEQTRDDTDRLEDIWQTKSDQIRKIFQNNEVQFINLPDLLPKITTKFSDLPLSRLVTASNVEKIDFAKSLHSRFYNLYDIMGI